MVYENGAIIVGGVTMTILGVVAVLFVIILALVGLKKGFGAQLFGLLGTAAVLIVSVLLSPAVSQFLRPLLGETIKAPISNWVAGFESESAVNVFKEVLNWSDAGVRTEYMPTALAAMGIPALISGLLNGAMSDVFSGFGTAALENALPELLTTWALTAIAFIVLLLLCSVLLRLIKRAFKGLGKIRIFGTANKVFGLLFGLIKAYVYISIFLMLVLMIPSGIFGFDIVNDQIVRSPMLSYLFENNIIAVWLIKILPAA